MSLFVKAAKNDPDITSTAQRLGVSTVAELVALVEHGEPVLAAEACLLLARVASRRESAVLLAALEHDDPELWMPASVALTLMESKRPIRALMELASVRTRHPRQRYAAVYALAFSSAALSHPRYGLGIASLFQEILSDSRAPASVRGVAAEGLGNMFGACFGTRYERGTGYEEAGGYLLSAMCDPEPEVRFWAIFAAGTMNYRPALPLLRDIAERDRERFGRWWTVGEEASDTIDRLEGRDPPDRELVQPQTEGALAPEYPVSSI